ncbi:MAG: 7-carboxy-7-deazaguanine synthase QueE [Prevotella sp.]
MMRINEIFYSLQGEGCFTGVPAVFIRFSGCNMRCTFCDTRHESYTEMTEKDIVAAVCEYPASHVVITGGEPTLQLNSTLIRLLHESGHFVQIETNGTFDIPADWGIDWITCSPKQASVVISNIDELKVIYQKEGQDMSRYDNIVAKHYSLQPCDYNDKQLNDKLLRATIDFCLANPKWRLSLQTHKIINIR